MLQDTIESLTQKIIARQNTKKKSKFYQSKENNLLEQFPETAKQFQILNDDPSLEPFVDVLAKQHDQFLQQIQQILNAESTLINFGSDYKTLGLSFQEESVTYSEWAPGAKEISILGEFNEWNQESHQLAQSEENQDIWRITIPNQDGVPAIPANTLYKVRVLTKDDKILFRVPIMAQVIEKKSEEKGIAAVATNNLQQFQFNSPNPMLPNSHKLYEVDFDKIFQLKDGKSSIFADFTENYIPHIEKQKYNGIIIQKLFSHQNETNGNIIALNQKYGSLKQLQALIDEAHKYKLTIIIDINHSFPLIQDNINWDGTDFQYNRKADGQGMRFDFSKWEVIQMLLSSLSYFLNELRVDGFRFTNLQSVLYVNEGSHIRYPDQLEQYFNQQLNFDGLVYLQIANIFIHLFQNKISIAFDNTHFPTIGRRVRDGGLGFDYLMSNTISQRITKFLETDANVSFLVDFFLQRRYDDKYISSFEDQNEFKNSQNISFFLDGQKLHQQFVFSTFTYQKSTQLLTDVIQQQSSRDRIILFQNLRVLTMALAGEGISSQMGSEILFNKSLEEQKEDQSGYFDIADVKENTLAKYLTKFNEHILKIERNFQILSASDAEELISQKNNEKGTLVFERGNLLFVFNFHKSLTHQNHLIGTRWNSTHYSIFDSSEFTDEIRVILNQQYPYSPIEEKYDERPYTLSLTLPPNSCKIYVAEGFESIDDDSEAL